MAVDNSRTIELEVRTIQDMAGDLDTKWATVSPKAKIVWLNMAQGSLDRLKEVVRAELKLFYPDEELNRETIPNHKPLPFPDDSRPATRKRGRKKKKGQGLKEMAQWAEIGERLKSLRNEEKDPQSTVASMIYAYQTEISKLEQGKLDIRTAKTSRMIKDYAELYGKTLQWAMGLEPEPVTQS